MKRPAPAPKTNVGNVILVSGYIREYVTAYENARRAVQYVSTAEQDALKVGITADELAVAQESHRSSSGPVRGSMSAWASAHRLHRVRRAGMTDADINREALHCTDPNCPGAYCLGCPCQHHRWAVALDRMSSWEERTAKAWDRIDELEAEKTRLRAEVKASQSWADTLFGKEEDARDENVHLREVLREIHSLLDIDRRAGRQWNQKVTAIARAALGSVPEGRKPA